MMSDTEARKSVAMTCAPSKPLTPVIRAVSPLSSMSGAKPSQFLHMHEAVLEDRLAHLRGAVRHAHQRDELRLQIRGEAREGLGLDRHRFEAPRRSARHGCRSACSSISMPVERKV